MRLKAFEGEHLLTGVDIKVHKYGVETVNCLSFELDGVVYTTEENPNYGSSLLEGISESKDKIKNKFLACKVIGAVKEDLRTKKLFLRKEEDSEIIKETFEFTDLVSGRVVLRFGVDYKKDDGRGILEFTPENMTSEATRKLREMIERKKNG